MTGRRREPHGLTMTRGVGLTMSRGVCLSILTSALRVVCALTACAMLLFTAACGNGTGDGSRQASYKTSTSEMASTSGRDPAGGTGSMSGSEYMGRYLLVGDSVTDACSERLQQLLPDGVIDAVPGRSPAVALEVYESHDSEGNAFGDVIFELGYNGAFGEEDLEGLIASVGSDTRIFFVSLRTPSGVQDVNNALFWQMASEHDNVHVIDWYAVSEGHDEYIGEDGIHLTDVGIGVYTSMIEDALVGNDA